MLNNTIIACVSKNSMFIEDIPQNMLKAFLEITENCNILIGRKTWEYVWDRIPIPRRKNYILSRKKRRYKGGKVITRPIEFRDGYVVGGRSTIATMTPYCNGVILLISNKNAYGGSNFPMPRRAALVDELEDEDFSILEFEI